MGPLLAVIQRKGNSKVSAHKVSFTRDLFLLPLSPLASCRIVSNRVEKKYCLPLFLVPVIPVSQSPETTSELETESGNWIASPPTAA